VAIFHVDNTTRQDGFQTGQNDTTARAKAAPIAAPARTSVG
jgi:hypothetical protein